jgi:sulfur carrier protein
MQVRINGETQQVDEGITLAGLIADLDLANRRIAVEINQTIVPRTRHAETPIRENDNIEIIHAIGGG